MSPRDGIDIFRYKVSSGASTVRRVPGPLLDFPRKDFTDVGVNMKSIIASSGVSIPGGDGGGGGGGGGEALPI
jgi:hypothetical protein